MKKKQVERFKGAIKKLGYDSMSSFLREKIRGAIKEAEVMKKEDTEIIHLHNKIIGHRASLPQPMLKGRDEYLRGWERALRWVMGEEAPPTEFLEKEEG